VDWTLPSLTVAATGIIWVWINKGSLFMRGKKGSYSAEEKQLLERTYKKLITLFETTDYFLNKNIKVSDAASVIETNEKVISKAINSQANTNFNDFVNSYRITYAKSLLNLVKYQNYTIEAIAEESGFSNKVSFYTAFKKKVGISPSEFRALKQSKNQIT